MSLDNWDATLNRLDALERRSEDMIKLAAEMQDILKRMQERPCFETKAQDRLAQLQNRIGFLFAFCKATNELYSKLPQTA